MKLFALQFVSFKYVIDKISESSELASGHVAILENVQSDMNYIQSKSRQSQNFRTGLALS